MHGNGTVRGIATVRHDVTDEQLYALHTAGVRSLLCNFVKRLVDGAYFDAFVTLLGDHDNLWSKVTCPERLSLIGPPRYDDFVPFARRLVETFPNRVLWGTDWPHPNLKSHMPDDGTLVDMIPRIAPTDALQQQLLVDNPMMLYWKEDAA